MSRSKVLWLALLACGNITSESSGALIDNNNFTTDTETGLDWLDLTESTNYSYVDVSNQFQAGGIFEGWRYATQDDVSEFWTNAGISGFGHRVGLPAPLDFVSENAAFDDLVSLWGQTDGPQVLSRAITSTTLVGNDDSVMVAMLARDTSLFGLASTGGGTLPKSSAFEMFGHALIRNTIPEPGVALLILLISSMKIARPRRNTRYHISV